MLDLCVFSTTLIFQWVFAQVYVIFHNILSTSLRHLHLPLLRHVNSLSLWMSLFVFPMTSAASVILDEEQKGNKSLKTAYHKSTRKLFLLPLSYTFFISYPLPLLRILQLLVSLSLSLSLSLFFPFILHAWNQEGLRLSFSRTRLLLEGENISIINSLYIPL